MTGETGVSITGAVVGVVLCKSQLECSNLANLLPVHVLLYHVEHEVTTDVYTGTLRVHGQLVMARRLEISNSKDHHLSAAETH